MYNDLLNLVNKLNKLIYLELVKNENVNLKRGLLNTIILDCEDIKKKHLDNKKEGVKNEDNSR